MAQKVLHKKSSKLGSLPEASIMDYGEIAVNYNAEDPFLSIKAKATDENDYCVKFIPEEAITNKIKTAFDALEETVIDNELVTANALTTLNDNINNINDMLDGFKVIQEPVSDPNSNGSATAFIDSITQDENGKITVTKKNVVVSEMPEINTATKSVSGITKLVDGDLKGKSYADGMAASQSHTHSNYKTAQTAVSSPNASGNATAFIDTISQNANGVISVTKKNVQFPTATKTVLGEVELVDGDLNGKSYADGMAASQSHTHSQYSTTDHTHSQYVNQNAFSNITVGSTTVAADSATDTVTFVAEGTLSITPDASADKLTFKVDDSSYSKIGHNHDDRYYTETEIDTKLNDYATSSELETLENTVIDNELVTANALTTLNDSINNLAETIETNYKPKQEVVTSASSEDGNAITFVDTVSQDENGVITYTKKTITPESLGLENALRYCGITTTNLTDGSTTTTVVIDGKNHTAQAGCVVFYGENEFVFNGNKWEKLGGDVTYKVVQDPVSSPNASGNATAFIDAISQDANGVISVTKKNVQFPTATKSVSGITKLVDGDLKGKSYADGMAASQSHTHSNYKTTQTAVSSPNASGNATAFIDTISQNANGVISVTKKNVDFSNYLERTGGTSNDFGLTSELGITLTTEGDSLRLISSEEIVTNASSNFYFNSENEGTIYVNGDAVALNKDVERLDSVIGIPSNDEDNIEATGIFKIIEDNEYVIAESLSDLDDRVNNMPFILGAGLKSVVHNASGCVASGDYSVAEGSYTSALSPSSHTEGDNTMTIAVNSWDRGAHAEGINTTAIGAGAHSEGIGSYRLKDEYTNNPLQQKNTEYPTLVAKEQGAHAEGVNTMAIGSGAHSEGGDTVANAQNAHAEGGESTASGWCSHAEGYRTTSSSDASHAEGYYSNAVGFASHAEGGYCTANGRYSHVEGYGTLTDGIDEFGNLFDGAHVEGRLNIVVPGAIHSVGIGTADDNRFNAHDIMLDGRHYIYGVGGYDGKNPNDAFDLASCLQRVYDNSSATYNLVGTDISDNEVGIIYSDIVMENNSISAPNGFFERSDERFKNFGEEIEVDFEKLKTLPKSYFTWKEDETEKVHIGTSAQKVKELYPELIGGNEDCYNVDYAKLSIVALKAIDKLYDENQKLKEELDMIKKHLGL